MLRASGGTVYAIVSKTIDRKVLRVRIPLRPQRYSNLKGENLECLSTRYCVCMYQAKRDAGREAEHVPLRPQLGPV